MAEPSFLPDRYRLLQRLGSGTFATVYLAEDTKMGRHVAVKVVEKSRDLEGRALREAQAAAKLSHPHIVTVFEVTQQADRTLLFTEYVEGATLRELFQKGRLTDSEIVQVGIQACRALEHAHKRGVVHRDIKPENMMMVRGDGVDVRIMDFGVAHLEDLTSITVDGQLLGTLAYMAPEQLDGHPVDAKTDVYALALTLYEGLTGTNPYRGKDAGELLRGTAVPVVPRLTRLRPDLPRILADALELGLEADPGLRPDAAGMRKQLERAGRELPEPTEQPTLVMRTVEAIRPVTERPRVTYAAQRVVAGACALATTAYVLSHVPFYPEGLARPPGRTGLLSLAPPAGGRGRPDAPAAHPPHRRFRARMGSALPAGGSDRLRAPRLAGTLLGRAAAGCVPLLVTWHLGLILLPLGGLLLRRWGPLGGLLAGSVLAVTAGMEGWALLPYTFSPGPGPMLLATRHVALPGDVLVVVARFLDRSPELLLQVGLFAVFSLPLAVLVRDDPVRRLWVAAGYCAALLLAFAVLPPLLTGASVALGPLLVALGPCAILVVLIALLTPVTERPLVTSEG